MKGASQEQKMLNSMNTKLEAHLSEGPHLLQEQMIDKTCTAMEVQECRADKVTSTKGS